MSKPILLLTGGSGMVGRNILEHPMANNWNVVAPSSKVLDLTDSEAVREFVRKLRPEIIVHAAGQVGGIQANISSPIAFLERNVSIGRNIIMAGYLSGVRQFLNLASTCMYPRAATNPLREEMILTGELEPTNEGYAIAKIVATRLCQYIRREDPGAQYKTIIPCNLFGRHDKFDPKSSHLLPAIIHKIHRAKLQGQEKVEIWGDGTSRREFMYAGDLADAILRAAADIHEIPDLMNCGLGRDYSINEFYQSVADIIGWSGDFVYDLTKPTGMTQKLCSIERQVGWGWSASTSMNDGILKTYEFYLNEAQK
jgi:GDP-L-fucose synthase